MFQKRNIVLAALILALGTAVYINWRYTSGEGALSAGASTGSQVAQLGDVLYVNGEVASAPSSDASSERASTGENNSSSDTSSQPSASISSDGTAYFSEAVLSRQRARDEAVELLKDILESAANSDAAKKEAVAQAARIAEDIARETKIESLLKAKGYENCLAMLEEDKANIIVGTDGLLEHETITIKDIVHSQSGIPFADIIIVEVK